MQFFRYHFFVRTYTYINKYPLLLLSIYLLASLVTTFHIRQFRDSIEHGSQGHMIPGPFTHLLRNMGINLPHSRTHTTTTTTASNINPSPAMISSSSSGPSPYYPSSSSTSLPTNDHQVTNDPSTNSRTKKKKTTNIRPSSAPSSRSRSPHHKTASGGGGGSGGVGTSGSSGISGHNQLMRFKIRLSSGTVRYYYFTLYSSRL